VQQSPNCGYGDTCNNPQIGVTVTLYLTPKLPALPTFIGARRRKALSYMQTFWLNRMMQLVATCSRPKTPQRRPAKQQPARRAKYVQSRVKLRSFRTFLRRSLAYDGRARLTSYTVGTASQTMLYNGADERIRVVTTTASGPTDTRQFVYDLDHRIVGEYGAGGAADLKAEYIWTLSGVGETGPAGGDDGTGGYTPLAVAVGVAGQSGITSELQWVHASHLGTPILTTNTAGQSVTPYGYAAIGFPGQFANALLLPGAEHYYNRYRDYDPTTGRYSLEPSR
jgi:hypothetical protein